MVSSDNRINHFAPRPQWSFAEIVQHAWQVYPRVTQSGKSNRIILIKIWAEMVGADRAVAELEHYIDLHGSVEAAADSIGCAVSTVHTLRRQFKNVDTAPLTPVPLSLSRGEKLRGKRNDYEVVEKMGSGGMGVVYKIFRKRDSNHFAAKILSSKRFLIDNIIRDRFIRESRIANKFRSPRVVRSIECLYHRGTLVSVMELLNGETLYDKLIEERSSISLVKRVEWIEQAIEGVCYLHKKDIVHRDLSPRNCMFRDDGTIAVGDFGVSRRIDDYTMTTIHERMGSLIYISAQQRENPHNAKFNDDVFALGQLAFHVLTGTSPHNAIETLEDLGYPAKLASWVNTMRHPVPSKRPNDAIECLDWFKMLRFDWNRLPKYLPN